MASARRRGVSSFNLAFLDIMFCGFGAVVLLVLIINSNALKQRKEVFDDLRGEVDRLETEVKAGQKNLVEIKNSLDETDKEVLVTRGLSREVLAAITRTKQELADSRNTTVARKADVKKLESDLKALEAREKTMGARAAAAADRGRKINRFTGDGQRQYLTGLKLGGRRVLILLDRSASMLDSSIINVIRRRNMSKKDKMAAPKWRRARRTVDWLVANLPPSSQLQVYGFNTSARSVLNESNGQWISGSDSTRVKKLVAAVHKLVPEKGTSLENAFIAAASMQPPPDNILLVTDGLPTQGRSKPSSSSVSGAARVRLFEQAVRARPRMAPINTILFPMEGDPMAAALYWKLAVDTRGSFLTPSSDWP
jgi:hypothetical protein